MEQITNKLENKNCRINKSEKVLSFGIDGDMYTSESGHEPFKVFYPQVSEARMKIKVPRKMEADTKDRLTKRSSNCDIY